MRKIMFAVLAALCLVLPALGQDPDSTAGPGAPSAQSPVPDCIHFKKYRDTLTGNLWTASGVPCSWVQAGGAGYAGVTSDGASGLNLQGVTYADGKKQIAAAYNTPGLTVSPLCPSGSSTCIKIAGDTKYETDCTSNSTTTLTCPSGNFTNADVGKVIWATTQGTGAGVGYLIYTTKVCGQTTIASVTNSTTVVLTAACTASGTGNVVAIWGTDDGPTLNTYLNGSNLGCNVVHVATAGTFIMTSKGFFNTTSGCNTQLTTSMGSPGPSLLGDGFGASQATFVMTPNFDWTGSCVGVNGASGPVCFGGVARSIANIGVWGTGLTSAANSNCANASGKVVLSAAPPSSIINGVDINGICPGQSGLRGLETSAIDVQAYQGGAQQVGQYACSAHNGAQQMIYAQDCRNDAGGGGFGLIVDGGATVGMYTSFPIVSAYITGSSSVTSFNSVWFAGSNGTVEVNSGSFTSYNDAFLNFQLDSGTSAFSTNSKYNGTVTLTGATFNSNSDTFSPSAAFTIDSSSKHYSTASTYGPLANNGTFNFTGINNKFANIPTGTGNFIGQGVIKGGCKGTAASSSTIYLNPAGQTTSPNCTVTTPTSGTSTIISQNQTTSALRLTCLASHGGVNGSSGVVTVLKNGSATTLTCTFGTGTGCLDSTHFDSGSGTNITDFYSFQVTTQASEVLADISCTVIAQ